MDTIKVLKLVSTITVLSLGFLLVSCERNQQGPVGPYSSGGGSLLKAAKGDYSFDVSSGTASRSNGDNITLDGSGPLTGHPKDAEGGGTFTYTPASGTSVSGFWVVKSSILRVFQSYGPEDQCIQGGRATMVINLSPGLDGSDASDATLTLISPVGSPPASVSSEGIIVSVKGPSDFNQDIGGSVTFTLTPCP
jgi:hypothetical protein